jgi:hypothetical protein
MQSERHSEEDKAWERKLSKKCNDLTGSCAIQRSNMEDAQRAEEVD